MHLNKDNLYEQQVEFDYAVEVLCDNIKDYDIKKVKLVRCHLTHSMLFLTLTTYVPFMISVTFNFNFRNGFQYFTKTTRLCTV
jgi:hypothetical protein